MVAFFPMYVILKKCLKIGSGFRTTLSTDSPHICREIVKQYK